MLIVISPAKTLDFENPPSTREYTLPSLLKYSEKLIEDCRQLTPEQIASLMKVSDKIAGLNYVRFSEWHSDFTLDNAKQALFAFRGDVYTGLDADSLSTKDFNQSQKHLRILSGLYGLLRPLDLMMPYRLEMGTGLKNSNGKNLYEFWGNAITEEVNKALVESGSDILVNLASNEYFKSVKTNLIKGRIITPVFKDFKNGKYKVISFYAKKARGMMSRYIIQNAISSVNGLKSFNLAGYYFCESQSNDAELVFLREEQ